MEYKIKSIKLPLFVLLPRKTKADKKAIINLNNYRNWQFFLSNQIKIIYKESMAEELEGMKFNGRIKLHFILFRGTNRRIDRSNVLSIHEKFFCDALTEFGCIEDDNDNFIEETKYSSGEILKEDPHVRVDIYYKKSL